MHLLPRCNLILLVCCCVLMQLIILKHNPLTQVEATANYFSPKSTIVSVLNYQTTSPLPSNLAVPTPSEICVLDNDDVIFRDGNSLKRYYVSNHTVSIFVATTVKFLTKSPAGQCFYSDSSNNIKVISNLDNTVRTLSTANALTCFTFDEWGNIYTSENSKIRMLNTTGGSFIVVGGTGTSTPNIPNDGSPAISTNIKAPSSLLARNGTIYFTVSHSIMKIENGRFYRISGSWNVTLCNYNVNYDGLAANACLISPKLISIIDGEIYFIDKTDSFIRKITKDGKIVLLFGMGEALNLERTDQLIQNVSFGSVKAMQIFPKGNYSTYYISLSKNIVKVDQDSKIKNLIGRTVIDLSYSTYQYGIQFSLGLKPIKTFRNGDILIFSNDQKTLYKLSRRTGILKVFFLFDLQISDFVVDTITREDLYIVNFQTDDFGNNINFIQKFNIYSKSLQLIAGNNSTTSRYQHDGQSSLDISIINLGFIKFFNGSIYYSSQFRIIQVNLSDLTVRCVLGLGYSQGYSISGLNLNVADVEFDTLNQIVANPKTGTLILRSRHLISYIDDQNKVRPLVGTKEDLGDFTSFPAPADVIATDLENSPMGFHPISNNLYFAYNTYILEYVNSTYVRQVLQANTTIQSFTFRNSNGDIYYSAGGYILHYYPLTSTHSVLVKESYNMYLCMMSDDTTIAYASIGDPYVKKYNIVTQALTTFVSIIGLTSPSITTRFLIRSLICIANNELLVATAYSTIAEMSSIVKIKADGQFVQVYPPSILKFTPNCITLQNGSLIISGNLGVYRVNGSSIDLFGGQAKQIPIEYHPISSNGWTIADNGDIYFMRRSDVYNHKIKRAVRAEGYVIDVLGNGTDGYSTSFSPSTTQTKLSDFTKDGSYFIEIIPSLWYSPKLDKYYTNPNISFSLGTSTFTQDEDIILYDVKGLHIYNVDCNRDKFGYCLQNFTCFGIFYNNDSSCSGNGDCTRMNSCECFDNFYSEDCSITTCNGIMSNESNVCSSHGQCVDFESCKCEDNYYGHYCNITTCFGFLSNDSSVCAGNGSCIGLDICHCNLEHFGLDCNETNQSFNNMTLDMKNSSISNTSTLNISNSTINNSTYFGNSSNIVNNTYLGNSTVDKSASNSTNWFNNSNNFYNTSSETLNNTTVPSNNSDLGNNTVGVNETSNCTDSLSFNSTNIYNSSHYLNGTFSQNTTNSSFLYENSTNFFNGHLLNETIVMNITVSNSTSNNYTNINNTLLNSTVYNNCSINSTAMNISISNSSDLITNNTLTNSTINNNNLTSLNLTFSPVIKCYGFEFNDLRVCNGHGACVSENSCLCSQSYEGSFCENKKYSCYGVFQSDILVCSGHGLCLSADNCQCNNGFIGSRCFATYDPPNINSLGNTLEFHFNTSGVYSNRILDCNKVIHENSLSLFGINPSCFWKDGNLFIELGGQYSLTAYSNISLNINAIDTFPLAYTSYKSLLVLPSNNPVKPIIKVSYKDVISPCEQILIDASGSYCGDLKPVKFIWSVESTPDPKFNIEQLSFGNLNSTLVSNNISISGVYIIGLIVESSLSGSRSEKQFIEISKSLVPNPSLSLLTSKSSLINIEKNSLPIIIKKSIELPACYFDNKVFKYVWEQVSGPSINYQIDLNNDLVINEMSYEGEVSYSFLVKAISNFNPNSNATLLIPLSSKSTDLSLNIYASNLNTNQVEAVVEYVDPDNLNSVPEIWTWSCLDRISNQVCQDSTITDMLTKCSLSKSLTCKIPKSTLSKVSFTLNIQKGSRTISTIIDIDFPNTEQSIQPMISLISVMPNRFKLLKDEVLSLQLSVILGGDEKQTNEENMVREWSINGHSLSESMISKMSINPSSSSSLILSLSGLLENEEYEIIFKVSDRRNSLSSTYSYNFKIVKSPKSCLCYINPSSGYALETQFSFSCPGCQNAEKSIDFVFGFIDDKSGTKIPLYNLGEQFASYLPSPFLTEVMGTFVDIVDLDTGASVEFIKYIDVKTPAASTISQIKRKVKLWQTYAASLLPSDSAKLVFNSATIARTSELMIYGLTTSRSTIDIEIVYELREAMLDSMLIGLNQRNPLEPISDIHFRVYSFGLEALAYNSETIDSLPFEKLFNLTEKIILMASQNVKFRVSDGVDILCNSLFDNIIRLLTNNGGQLKQRYLSRMLNLMKRFSNVLMRNYYVGQKDYTVNMSHFSTISFLSYKYQLVRKSLKADGNSSVLIEGIDSEISNRAVLQTTLFSVDDSLLSDLLNQSTTIQRSKVSELEEIEIITNYKLLTKIVSLDKNFISDISFIFNRIDSNINFGSSNQTNKKTTIISSLECVPIDNLFSSSNQTCNITISGTLIFCNCSKYVTSLVVIEKIISNSTITQLESEPIILPKYWSNLEFYGLFGLFALLVVICCCGTIVILTFVIVRHLKAKKKPVEISIDRSNEVELQNV